MGLGYIGLPTAALLASKSVNVVGVDINQNTVDIINQGKIHIVELGLESLVKQVVFAENFRATTEPVQADAYLIAVPTPFKDDHKPDLSFIQAAVTSLAPYLRKGNLIILESTSPVGAADKLAAWLAESRPDLNLTGKDQDIHIAYCPERVLPGRTLKELVTNDRIIGGLTDKATEAAVELYSLFVEGRLLMTDSRTAEMAKLTENAFRDVNIAFANELSLICDKLDINVWELIELTNCHPRVNILQPGAGVGGHCIAVDPWFIVNSAPKQSQLIKQARIVNDAKPQWIIEKIRKAAEKMDNPTIGCLGLAFKPDVDDLRESPSLEIAKKLQEDNIGKLIVAEPNISEYEGLDLKSYKDVVKQSDILVILVQHQDFVDLHRLISKNQIVIDACGAFRLKNISKNPKQNHSNSLNKNLRFRRKINKGALTNV
jgi:UDP-N-acetyl-D-mannosaminuronic acid dehydrogenase